MCRFSLDSLLSPIDFTLQLTCSYMKACDSFKLLQLVNRPNCNELSNNSNFVS